MLTGNAKAILATCERYGYKAIPIITEEHPTEFYAQPITASASPALTTVYGLDDYLLIGGAHVVHADDLDDGKARRFSVEFVVVPPDCNLTEERFWAAKLQERRNIKKAVAKRQHAKKRGDAETEVNETRNVYVVSCLRPSHGELSYRQVVGVASNHAAAESLAERHTHECLFDVAQIEIKPAQFYTK